MHAARAHPPFTSDRAPAPVIRVGLVCLSSKLAHQPERAQRMLPQICTPRASLRCAAAQNEHSTIPTISPPTAPAHTRGHYHALPPAHVRRRHTLRPRRPHALPHSGHNRQHTAASGSAAGQSARINSRDARTLSRRLRPTPPEWRYI